MEFRPGWKWRAINAAAGVVLGGLGLVVTLAAVIDDAPWTIAAVGVAVIVGGFWLTVRVLLMGVHVGHDRLRTIGFLWSRTVPRDRIVRIDTEPQSASVAWSSRSDQVVVTPLSSLRTGDGFFPMQALERRRAFLRRLSSWVASGHVRESVSSARAAGGRRAWRAANPHSVRRLDIVWDIYGWAVPIAALIIPLAGLGIGKRSASNLTLDQSAIFVTCGAAICLLIVAAVLVRCLQRQVPSRPPRWSPMILVGGCVVTLAILWTRADWEPGDPLLWATYALAALSITTAITWILSRTSAIGADER